MMTFLDIRLQLRNEDRRVTLEYWFVNWTDKTNRAQTTSGEITLFESNLPEELNVVYLRVESCIRNPEWLMNQLKMATQQTKKEEETGEE